MQRSRRARRNIVIASAYGLTILVVTALAVLGWRLLSQEDAFEKQRRRDQLEQVADRWLASFLRTLDQYDQVLARADADAPRATSGGTPPVTGATIVHVSSADVRTTPDARLIYYPVVAPPAPLSSAFAAADRLEFAAPDFAAAVRLLLQVSRSDSTHARAESLLRLGRIHTKRKESERALAAYAELASIDEVSQADVPYSVLGYYARARLLAEDPATRPQAAEEARKLLEKLHSGRWQLKKETYAYYTTASRAIAGAAEAHPSADRIALAEAVDVLWNDWQRQETGEAAPSRRLHGSDPHTLLLVSRASADRLVALAVPWATVVGNPELSATAADVTLTIAGPEGQVLVGSAPSQLHAARTLSVAQLPGTVYFAPSDTAPVDLVVARRRTYVITGLVTVAIIVSLACYAMARGLLRELQATAIQQDFISTVSHEFRSPLTTLGQLTELLDDGRVRDEARRRQYVQVMRSETIRLQQLVENLLDFGRMEANARVYRPEAIDFTGLVRAAVYEYRDEVAASGYTFEVDADEAQTMVEADREALRRVVRNLLENAVKYSPECRTVWVEAGRENGHAVLKVRDRGIGIAVAEQRRIFERFVRGDGAKDACIQGSGIGLAMVREIVEAHRGQVNVDSAPGAGSTFVVQVPLSTTGEQV